MIYTAFHLGAKMTAKKVGNRWMVGGDYDTNGALILMPHEGGWAWFELRGAVLKFQDWAGEAEVAEMTEQEADPIKQLDTADEKPVRLKADASLRRTFYTYRGFNIKSQYAGYNANPYGEFTGYLKHPETGEVIKKVTGNQLKKHVVADIDRFWANYKAVA